MELERVNRNARSKTLTVEVNFYSVKFLSITFFYSALISVSKTVSFALDNLILLHSAADTYKEIAILAEIYYD